MSVKDRELREAIKSAIRTLILQEIRVLQLEQAYTPSFVMDEMGRSIEEMKKHIISLVRWMEPKERNALIKRVIRQSVDEEIDRAIKTRRNRCLRCIHIRFFDEEGAPHVALPIRKGRARVIGCKITSNLSKIQCKGFMESPAATSFETYLQDMTLFYEVKEMFDQFEGIWEDYFTK